MNIGYTAANGKTTEMDIHEKAFPLYTEKLDRTIFSKTCTKRHKYANKLVTCPIRLAYINELDDSKLDEDFLKDFADGKDLPLEQMYGTMCNNYGLPVIGSCNYRAVITAVITGNYSPPFSVTCNL